MVETGPFHRSETLTRTRTVIPVWNRNHTENRSHGSIRVRNQKGNRDRVRQTAFLFRYFPITANLCQVYTQKIKLIKLAADWDKRWLPGKERILRSWSELRRRHTITTTTLDGRITGPIYSFRRTWPLATTSSTTTSASSTNVSSYVLLRSLAPSFQGCIAI